MIQKAPLSTPELRYDLWKKDPRFKQQIELNKNYKEAIKESDFEGSRYRAYMDWNPALEYRHDYSDLQKRFHPAVVRGEKIHVIDDVGLDAIKSPFTWDPKLVRELPQARLLGRCITVHISGLPSSFLPSIHEVLTQLPPHLAELPGNLYFITEPVHFKLSKCSLGGSWDYKAAVTSIYEEVKRVRKTYRIQGGVHRIYKVNQRNQVKQVHGIHRILRVRQYILPLSKYPAKT